MDQAEAKEVVEVRKTCDITTTPKCMSLCFLNILYSVTSRVLLDLQNRSKRAHSPVHKTEDGKAEIAETGVQSYPGARSKADEVHLSHQRTHQSQSKNTSGDNPVFS